MNYAKTINKWTEMQINVSYSKNTWVQYRFSP